MRPPIANAFRIEAREPPAPTRIVPAPRGVPGRKTTFGRDGRPCYGYQVEEAMDIRHMENSHDMYNSLRVCSLNSFQVPRSISLQTWVRSKLDKKKYPTMKAFGDTRISAIKIEVCGSVLVILLASDSAAGSSVLALAQRVS